MTYTFTLYVNDHETEERIYAEYHNFRRVEGGYVYYRGGSNHLLEMALTEESAINSMAILIAEGWTCDNPKIISVYATLPQCPTTLWNIMK